MRYLIVLVGLLVACGKSPYEAKKVPGPKMGLIDGVGETLSFTDNGSTISTPENLSVGGTATLTGLATLTGGFTTGAGTITGVATLGSASFSGSASVTGLATLTGGFTTGALASLGAHEETTAPAGGALTSCGGGSPVLATGSTDTAGQITEGSTATGCVMAFGATYGTGKAPFCTCNATTNITVGCSTTATALTIVNTSASGDVINYRCTGQAGGS